MKAAAHQYLTYGFLLLVGASGWIMLETTHIAPPVCVVQQDLYDAAQPISANVKKR